MDIGVLLFHVLDVVYIAPLVLVVCVSLQTL